MKNVARVFGRTVLGSYLVVHGAQKLFGSFGGPGLDATGTGFHHLGLTPGKPMAMLAGGAELGGGLLTAAGIADPLGPIAIAGAMTVASAVHRASGPLAANGGFELPLTNLALATVLAATDPGALRIGPRSPRRLTALVGVGAIVLAALSLVKLRTHVAPAATVAGPETSAAAAA